jgi:hypothetical protein
MSDKPNSIWNRPIKGWRLLAARLVIFASLTVLVSSLTMLCLIPSSYLSGRVFWLLSIGIAFLIASLLVLGFFFVRWLCCWRNLKRLPLVFACLATAVALLYAEENFRGKHAWNRFRKEAEARGEQLDWKAFVPKPVPDEQNFAATPLIKSWFVLTNTDVNPSFSPKDNISQAGSRVSWTGITDLVAWKQALEAVQDRQTNTIQRGVSLRWSRDSGQQIKSGKLDRKSRAEAAPAVLEALKTNKATFAELRAASQRPFCRYPIEYDSEDPAAILLPHLNYVRAVCRRFSLKACAELAAGQSGNALEDVRLMLYIADSLKDEPFLISYLVRIACLGITIQPIGEGLAAHAWSDVQLQDMQVRLQQYDMLADSKRALEAERAAGILFVDSARKRGLNRMGELVSPSTRDNLFLNVVGRWIPRGWYYLEKLNYCRLFEFGFAGAYDSIQKRVSPSKLRLNENRLDRQLGQGAISGVLRHHIVSRILVQSLSGVARRAAAGQIAIDEASLACSLERYRLKNGQFPDNLDTLVPVFVSKLPHDPTTGEPYKYRRTDDGSFVLYSVGWNEKDDGGVPGKTDFDGKEGDWVWQYPPQS